VNEASNQELRANRPGNQKSLSARVLRPALALCLCAAFASSVLADAPAGLAKYGGSYKYAGSREDGIAGIDKAVDKAMADDNMVKRLLVKHWIEQKFAELIVIDLPPGKIGIKVGDGKTVTIEIGKTEEVKGEDGRTGKITHSFDGSKITQK